MKLFNLFVGSTPLLVNIPHAGVYVPDGISHQMTASALALPDTDWFVDVLYEFVTQLDVSLLCATHSRYVIDLNRPSDNAPLYAQKGTGLVPEIQFSGQNIYAKLPPSDREIAQRIDTYWRPYHLQLAQSLSAIRDRHGYAILLDAHSIRSQVNLLFSGTLPVFNIGTNSGESADLSLIDTVTGVFQSQDESWVLDQRFKGGHITREYGAPETGVHAIQLEIAQRGYMQEEPPELDGAKLEDMQRVLRTLIQALLNWHPE